MPIFAVRLVVHSDILKSIKQHFSVLCAKRLKDHMVEVKQRDCFIGAFVSLRKICETRKIAAGEVSVIAGRILIVKNDRAAPETFGF